jgi:transcriptional antiterminator RfaH
MPYATGLVVFGGEPAIVPDTLIHAIHNRLAQIDHAGGEQLDGLKPGDAVTIDNGPFAGYEAIFDMRMPGSERVRVLLKMLNDRSLPVELRAGQIHKKKKPNPPYQPKA